MLFLCHSVTDTYLVIQITLDTTVEEVMVEALDQFGLDSVDINRYRLVEVSQEKGCKQKLTEPKCQCRRSRRHRFLSAIPVIR